MDKLRLLIIEDDLDQRSLIAEVLEDRFGPNTVTSVGCLREAMQQDLCSFSLILSDYNLPDASGLELLDRIKQHCDTPIIMVTGENVGRLAAEAIEKGANDYVVKLGDYLFTIPLVVEKNLQIAKMQRENLSLRAELEGAMRQLQESNEQLKQSLARTEEMAATDPLTGLYNRRHFGQVLEQMCAESQRYRTSLSCVMIDLDSYKLLNDRFGHQVGDQLLALAGKVISANMRRMDVAARYGGDEFVLLIPRATGNEATHLAQRIREEYRYATATAVAETGGVTMSVGIASLASNGPATADQLVAQADAALYRAKEAGRDRIAACASERSLTGQSE